MNYLDQFKSDQRDFLVSLPYKVGYWVSESDQTGGDQADEAEKTALESIIISFGQDYCKSEFIEEIMRETLLKKDKWPQWEQSVESTPQDCTKAVEIISEKLDQKDVLSFKQNLMEVAVHVAMAFQEVSPDEGLVSKAQIYGRYAVKVLMAKIKHEQPPNFTEILNISSAEEQALKTLGEALRMDMDDGLVSQSDPEAETKVTEGGKNDQENVVEVPGA